MTKIITLILIKTDYYCNSLDMKHHVNTSTYPNLDAKNVQRVFNNLNSQAHKSCLTKNETKYIYFR